MVEVRGTLTVRNRICPAGGGWQWLEPRMGSRCQDKARPSHSPSPGRRALLQAPFWPLGLCSARCGVTLASLGPLRAGSSLLCSSLGPLTLTTRTSPL